MPTTGVVEPGQPGAGFPWRDEFSLHHPQMDAVHREFVACVDALFTAPDERMDACVDAMVRHLRRHFEQEATWMQLGAYPGIEAHECEHADALGEALQVRERVAAGCPAAGRNLARWMVAWFEQHAAGADRQLAGWLDARGGARQPGPGSFTGR